MSLQRNMEIVLRMRCQVFFLSQILFQGEANENLEHENSSETKSLGVELK